MSPSSPFRVSILRRLAAWLCALLLAAPASAQAPAQAPPPPAEPPPPNLFSNRFEQKSGTPASVTVILLDALNTKFEDMAYARQQIIKFLGQVQPQDRVALYSLTTHLTVLHDFTSDATRLLQALDRFKRHSSATLAASEPDPDSGPAETGIAQLDAFLSGAFQREADFFTTNRARQTAGAIEAIANHVARLPGRKNLIWVSGGFPFYIGFDGDAPASPTQETAHVQRVRGARRARPQQRQPGHLSGGCAWTDRPGGCEPGLQRRQSRPSTRWITA